MTPDTAAEQERQHINKLYDEMDVVARGIEKWTLKIRDLPELERAAQMAVTATVLNQMSGGDAMMRSLMGIADQGFFTDIEEFES